MKKQNGFTLVEVMLGAILISLFVLGISSLFSYSANYQARQTLSNSISQIRTQIENSLANDSVWQATVADSINSNLACLKTGTTCAAMQTNPDNPDGFGFYLKNADRTAMTNEIGFTADGTLCTTPNPACIIQLNLTWLAQCTATYDVKCLQPLIAVRGVFTTTQNSVGLSLNLSRYEMQIFRQSLSQLCQGTAVTACANGTVQQCAPGIGWSCKAPAVYQCPPGTATWTESFTSADTHGKTYTNVASCKGSYTSYLDNGGTVNVTDSTAPTHFGTATVVCHGATSPTSLTIATPNCQANGQCGAANGKSLKAAPAATDECTSGWPSDVYTSGSSYTWQCLGENNTTNQACSAQMQSDGSCGAAQSIASSSMPSTNLCSSGTATAVTEDKTNWVWNWSCSGSNGGATKTCQAPVKADALCGPAAASSPSQPTSGYCSAGTVSGLGPGGPGWTWNCNGLNGGANLTCSATAIAAAPTPTGCAATPTAAGCACPSGFSGTFPNCTDSSFGCDSLTCDNSGNCTYTSKCTKVSCQDSAGVTTFIEWGFTSLNGVTCATAGSAADGCTGWDGKTFSNTSASCSYLGATGGDNWACTGSGAGKCIVNANSAGGTYYFNCSGPASALAIDAATLRAQEQLHLSSSAKKGLPGHCD